MSSSVVDQYRYMYRDQIPREGFRFDHLKPVFVQRSVQRKNLVFSHAMRWNRSVKIAFLGIQEYALEYRSFPDPGVSINPSGKGMLGSINKKIRSL